MLVDLILVQDHAVAGLGCWQDLGAVDVLLIVFESGGILWLSIFGIGGFIILI